MQLGLTTLFTSKADLRGVTKDAKNYQIEELVQHVAIRIDEGSSTENSISGNTNLNLKNHSMPNLEQTFSAGNIESRSNRKPSKLCIDKPFLFFVRDSVDDVILAAGKIVEIPVETEIPISFN